MTRLDYALNYATNLNWAVLPLHYIADNGHCSCGAYPCGKDNRSAGKHPLSKLVPHGVHDATKDHDTITKWFTANPNANIGIATGEISGFDVIDCDPRNGSEDTLKELELKHGKLPDTATQLTGGGGFHLAYKYNCRRMKSPGPGIDVKSSGGYIIVEPSNHASGGTYQWEGSADPTDGFPIADAPEWLKEAETVKKSSTETNGVGFLAPQKIADLRAALKYLDANHYETWIQVGQALHSTDAPEAFDIWDEWSQTADNYDNTTTKKYGTFNRGKGLNLNSIFTWARDNGWDGSSETIAIDASVIQNLIDNAAKKRQKKEVLAQTATPDHLLTIPGMLGNVVDWINATAPKSQPQFAVQSALALGSVLCGRRYVTIDDNWSSLFYINIGETGAGKEYSRTSIERILDAAGFESLIGPEAYTSESAVFTSLHDKPEHITIIDEIGEMLKASKSKQNTQKKLMVTYLMKMWGQCNGVVRQQGYSMSQMTAAAKADFAKRVIRNPALTLVGMSTPRTFWDGLDENSLEGGFLNRMIVVQSPIGAQKRQRGKSKAVPGSIIQWCQDVRAPNGTGNLAQFDVGAEVAPSALVVEITQEALALFDAYEERYVAASKRLKDEGLADLESRSTEKSMKLALVVAVSKSARTPIVDEECAQWAIDYIEHYQALLLQSVRENLHGSEFGQWRVEVMRVISRGGEKGRTEREMAKVSRLFAGLEPRNRKAVLESLAAEERIAFVKFEPTGGRGRVRNAWVEVSDED